jgi:hypothetical protein
MTAPAALIDGRGTPRTISAGNSGHTDFGDAILKSLLDLWPSLPRSLRESLLQLVRSANRRWANTAPATYTTLGSE